jgi:hypothetical protein
MASPASAGALCEDTAGWKDYRGKTCRDYETWCAAGAFRAGAEWAAGKAFNFPEQHCCVCGRGVQGGQAAPGPSASAFSVRANAMCLEASLQVRTTTVQACEAQCEESGCGCFFFQRGVCSIAPVYAGVSPTAKGVVSHTRIGATLGPDPRTAPSGGGRCAPARPTGHPPSFYLYDDPAVEWGARLTACFEQAHGVPPWGISSHNSSARAAGQPPHTQIAHGLWLTAALLMHPSRVLQPERATVYVVPAYGSLSEAVTTCGGLSHLSRMEAAAAFLKQSKWWAKAAGRHVILACTLPEDRNALGALGELTARGGAVALCSDTRNCVKAFQHRLTIPPLPLAPLTSLLIRDQTTKAACGPSAGRRRSYSIFFRGAHAKAHDAQELRARLWELRGLPGASIKFTRGGASTLEPSTRAWLASRGWDKDVRVTFSAGSYAYAAARSDFCVVVRGDGQNAGRMLVDAVTAGCVPLVIGDKTFLPFRKRHGGLLPYSDFTVTVDETEFMRFPAETVQRALAGAVGRLPALRRALLGARESLLLGYGEAPLRYNMTLAAGADTILRSVGMHLCPRNPVSLRSCVDAQSGAEAAVFF